MKKAVILLAVLAAGLAFALYRANQNAGAIAQQSQTQLGVSSNRIAELEMKLNHQEQLARSLGSQVTYRLEELSQRAAELARVRTSLAKSESETREARASLAAIVPARERLEAEIAGLKSRITELESSLAESAMRNRTLSEQLDVLNTQRNALALQLAHARQESAALETRLQNPDFLETQLDALHDLDDRLASTNRATPVASPRFQSASASKLGQSAKSSLQLELQPDGSVRAVSAQ